MANLIRSEKFGSDRLTSKLLAYNITVQLLLGHQLGSIDHFDFRLLSSADPTTDVNLSKETCRFLVYLDLVSRANVGQESAIHNLAKSVLQVTGFERIGTILRMQYDFPFAICGDVSTILFT